MLKKKLSGAEDLCKELKSELSYTSSNSQDRIRDLEVQAVTSQTKLVSMEQKLKAKHEEVQKLKLMAKDKDSIFNTQLEELQNRVRIHQNETQQRENEARSLLENNLKEGNDLKKNHALLDQKTQL